MSLKSVLAVLAICLAAHGAQAFKCYETQDYTKCTTAGACSDPVLTTQNVNDRCRANLYDCAASKDANALNLAKVWVRDRARKYVYNEILKRY